MTAQKSIFDFLNDICYRKIKWDEQLSRKDFQPYMITRWLSMHPDYLALVADVQHISSKLGDREFYVFFTDLLPKRKFFTKYLKSRGVPVYNDRLIDFVSDKFQMGRRETEYLLDTMEIGDVKAWIGEYGFSDAEISSMFGL